MVTATRGKERKLICNPEEHPDTEYIRIPQPDDFGSVGADFLVAKDLTAIGVSLMDHYEAQFAHLRKLHIVYAWKRAGGASNGNSTLGKCIKSSGLTKFFSDSDFVIWLAADHLREVNRGNAATFWQIEALVYHEMMHAQVNDQGAPTMRGHDFEGFGKEISEYGAWDESAEIIRVAFKQLDLL